MKLDRPLLVLILLLFAGLAGAQPLSYQIEELYSNADGSVQFVVLRETTGQAGQQGLGGRQLTATGLHATKTFTFPSDLPSSLTGNARVLIGSVGFQALGLIAPDYVFPDRFLPVDGGTLALVGIDSITYDPAGDRRLERVVPRGTSTNRTSPRISRAEAMRCRLVR